MKRFLMIGALLFTLCNVGAAVVSACKCYEFDELVCSGDFCWWDPRGGCQCMDEET